MRSACERPRCGQHEQSRRQFVFDAPHVFELGYFLFESHDIVRARRARLREDAPKFPTQSEWDYWYGGKPATTDIVNQFGKVMERPGAVRDGGAFWDRLGHIAAWNAVMDEDRYLTRRWNEFVTT